MSPITLFLLYIYALPKQSRSCCK